MAAKLNYCLFLIFIGQASSVVTHSLKRLEIDPELATQLAGLDLLELPHSGLPHSAPSLEPKRLDRELNLAPPATDSWTICQPCYTSSQILP